MIKFHREIQRNWRLQSWRNVDIHWEQHESSVPVKSCDWILILTQKPHASFWSIEMLVFLSNLTRFLPHGMMWYTLQCSPQWQILKENKSCLLCHLLSLSSVFWVSGTLFLAQLLTLVPYLSVFLVVLRLCSVACLVTQLQNYKQWRMSSLPWNQESFQSEEGNELWTMEDVFLIMEPRITFKVEMETSGPSKCWWASQNICPKLLSRWFQTHSHWDPNAIQVSPVHHCPYSVWLALVSVWSSAHTSVYLVFSLCQCPPVWAGVQVVFSLRQYLHGVQLGSVSTWCSACSSFCSVFRLAQCLHGVQLVPVTTWCSALSDVHMVFSSLWCFFMEFT